MSARVETAHGWIEGLELGRHQSFRGIPFARPPIGRLRWQPPQPVQPWAGTLSAREYGPACPQLDPLTSGGLIERQNQPRQSEDCLVLNVDTPRADGGRRPVLVWIHGGGFVSGAGSLPLYDGGRLAARCDVVVVTIQYRLGAFGYLQLAGLGGAALGAAENVGQLDQIAALRWVRDHIAEFGGDPANVTVFGESAGAMAIGTLLGMPAAQGLYRKAILQSGAASHVHFADAATAVARALLAELGIAPESLASLWDVPARAICEAQGRAAARIGMRFLAYRPVVDGESLPRAPLASVAAGELRDIPVLIGTNLDESKFFTLGAGLPEGTGDEDLLARLRQALPVHSASVAGALLDTYRKARQERGDSVTVNDLSDAIESDLRFRIPAIRLAEAQSAHQRQTYMYLWTWPSPARRGTLGACHAVDLPFVFGTLDAPSMDRFAGTGPEAEQLSTQVMDAWVAFARTGRPRHVGWPDWPGYTETQRHTFEIGRVPRLRSAPLDSERLAWEGVV